MGFIHVTAQGDNIKLLAADDEKGFETFNFSYLLEKSKTNS